MYDNRKNGMERCMLRNNKKIIITTILAIILIANELFFESNSDILGFSMIETQMIHIIGIVSNIIIPLGIIFVLILKKDLLTILLLVIRSFIYCVPIAMYAKENCQIDVMNFFTVVLSIIYIGMLLLLLFRKLKFERAIVFIILCRIATIFFSGNIFNLIYGLKYGVHYLIGNTLYMIASELLFIIPLIYCDKVKEAKIIHR